MEFHSWKQKLKLFFFKNIWELLTHFVKTPSLARCFSVYFCFYYS
jgi:hypothetical protein